MRYRTRSLMWHGQPFRFQRLPSEPHADAFWAVTRGREFIGTMACSTEVTTKEFDAKASHWIAELLGRPKAGRPPS